MKFDLKSQRNNVGKRLAQTMQMRSKTARASVNTPQARHGGLKIGGTGGIVSPVIMSPRHRKYFGLDKPHQPY